VGAEQALYWVQVVRYEHLGVVWNLFPVLGNPRCGLKIDSTIDRTVERLQKLWEDGQVRGVLNLPYWVLFIGGFWSGFCGLDNDCDLELSGKEYRTCFTELSFVWTPHAPCWVLSFEGIAAV
jgi:hypothetical protein